MSQAMGKGEITSEVGPPGTSALFLHHIVTLPPSRFWEPSPTELGSQFLTVSPLQCPVGLHQSCPWLKCLATHGCATK